MACIKICHNIAFLLYLSPDSPWGATELAASPPTDSENATCVVPVTVEAAPELLLLVEYGELVADVEEITEVVAPVTPEDIIVILLGWLSPPKSIAVVPQASDKSGLWAVASHILVLPSLWSLFVRCRLVCVLIDWKIIVGRRKRTYCTEKWYFKELRDKNLVQKHIRLYERIN